MKDPTTPGAVSDPSPPACSRMGARSRFLSDYGAAWIGEGIAFAGLCIGLAIARAEYMWALVIVWAFCMGPSKHLRDKSNAHADGSRVSDTVRRDGPGGQP